MTTMTVETTDPATLDKDGCWQAVLDGNPGFDGAFVLAVRTTGIYCRPTCPARTPKRENVSFLPSPEAARAAGFRACKRCRPDDAHRDSETVAAMRALCRHIDGHLDETLSLAALGDVAKMSPGHLQRTFKRVLGVSPRQYVQTRRLEAMKSDLNDGQPVVSALYGAGYGSTSRVYEGADSELGMTPAAYGKHGRGMRVGYVIVDCYLGRLLVAATGRGICAVSIGDDDATLEAALRTDFRLAEISRQESGLEGWVRGVLDLLDGQRPHGDLPLDLQATAFQRRVWQELQAIPFGETRTYGQIAAALDAPNAARAVGRACATNPVSLVVPCHRAVGANGSLTGYRWGIERKRALLERERERDRTRNAPARKNR